MRAWRLNALATSSIEKDILSNCDFLDIINDMALLFVSIVLLSCWQIVSGRKIFPLSGNWLNRNAVIVIRNDT